MSDAEDDYDHEHIHVDETVFEMNSYAVFRLQQWRYTEAIAKLHEAMATLHRIEEQGRLHPLDPPGFQLRTDMGYGGQMDNEIVQEITLLAASIDKSQYTHQIQYQHLSGHPEDDLLEDSSAVDVSREDNTCFEIFEMAFCTLYLNHKGTRGLRLTWCFVMYNLALCYHHREFVQSSKTCVKTANLQSALHLYYAALQIIRAAPQDGKPEDVTLLTLAICNNMGHIYCHLCNVRESRRCVRALQSVLRSADIERQVQTQKDISFFMISAITPPELLFQKAPAA